MSPRTLGFSFIALILATAASYAQDTITRKGSQPQTVEILGMTGDSIRYKVGAAETTVGLDKVESVKKAPPKRYTDAIAAWQAGNTELTLSNLKPLVDDFRGLPTPWAERASALLGDALIAADNTQAAENAFAAFQKAYPSSTSLANIGLARLAITKKDYADAKSRLQPIVAEAEKTLAAPAGKNATYGQAYYLLGMVKESEGAYPEALQDYLSTVTIFYEDSASVAKAQERADALIKDKKVIVP